ncbi:MAG TPA: bifunctional YncE family protein/alkaline phosphatase family protein [Clostridia bacterium]|nr:bifunctional YncE family protein/alkaline phosphatase family protein [Clostridia bacterium]
MRKTKLLLPALCLLAGCQTDSIEQVGPMQGGGHVMATHQMIRPAGESIEFGGRPVDLALSPDGATLYAKDNRGVVVIDTANWRIRQELKFSGGGSSVHGIVATRDGGRVWVTGSSENLWELKTIAEGKLEPGRKLVMPGNKGTGHAAPCGLTLSADEKTAYVCLSRNNALAVVDLESGKIVKQVAVGVAPYDVVLFAGGRKAFVSNWGGRRAGAGDTTADSAGTPAVVDKRGVTSSGTVSVVELEAGNETSQITTGLHPCDLELSADERTLYVANANSDTVSVIDTGTGAIKETIAVRPDPTLAFGSAPNALSLSRDGRTLYVANGGNNAIAVIRLSSGAEGASLVRGFIPTAWYPGGVLNDGERLYVANTKGIGSRNPNPENKGWNSHYHLGTVGRVEIPGERELEAQTRQVREDARVPQMLRAWDKSRGKRRPVPVPERAGEPSVFDHVVYIIKENRTYDQVFGDLPQGNGEPALCVFGREITPNHHALAEEFVLLDNYYCNGVCSADGHAWATEGYATDYLEKSFGGWARSYPFSGDDPLSFASTGFIWDQVLLNGLSFRNYGEMSKTFPKPREASFLDIYRDYTSKAGKITLEHTIDIDNLRRYSCPESPGWNMRVPDMIRADVFLREFEACEQRGDFPNLTIIFLPSDHTSGTRPGNPTPRAQVADNDLATGRIIERISQSRFWPKTCVFVIEDDPQNGFDHVDGHRSLCLVASPYTKRGAVVSRFYNQTSVLHTMSRMLGMAPMNQMVALAPVMSECFTSKPDLTPYRCRPNQVPLDEMNQATTQLQGRELHWARASLEQNLDEVDRADEDTMNRILWHAMKGVNTPYPEQFAGAHGRGLRKLGLALGGLDEDDD